MSAKKATKNTQDIAAHGGCSASPCSSSFEYPCTECGGDAYIGLTNWIDGATGKVLIGKRERLCNRCSKKRKVEWSFNAKPSPTNKKISDG